MDKKAYVLIKEKNNKVIGKFHNSRRAVKKLYKKQIEKGGYKIGVFTFSHDEDPSLVTQIPLWTDNWGVNYFNRKQKFFAVDATFARDMSEYHKFYINEEDAVKTGSRYCIEIFDSIDMIGKGHKE
ncbi:hypothetical protein NXG04_07870 [Klebsiella pneumoniae]|nr:hypothetical protein [Klebsiella pneumoniae]MDS7714472.1 hypothetical protein [Klebsiella pneumoniae]UUV46357.1 hypothetical protein [Bacillus phage vB_BanS-Thrax2]